MSHAPRREEPDVAVVGGGVVGASIAWGLARKGTHFFTDPRGWLGELFRNDLVPPQFHPVMAYVSMTKPGVARGPHEHVDQADCQTYWGGNFAGQFDLGHLAAGELQR